jgi:hypothetical protein
MTVHVLHDGHYAVVRCHQDEALDVVKTLAESDFQCGKPRDVLDIPPLVDVNIKRNGSWENIDASELRRLLIGRGFTVSGM